MNRISDPHLDNLVASQEQLGAIFDDDSCDVSARSVPKCECQSKVKPLQRRIKHLNARIRRLQAKVSLLNKPAQIDTPTPTFKDSLVEFIRLIDRHGFQFNVKTLIHTFLLNAETPEDAKVALQKTKTLSRVKSGVLKKKHKSRLDFYLRNRTNVNRIFPTKQDLFDNENSLSVVFGQNALKKVTESMLFFHLPMGPEYKHFIMKRAHFDGMFTNCPRPYKQSVELRVVLGHGDQEIVVTFARALLNGSKTENYVEFFEQARNMKLKKIPLIITDFEIAISNAIRQVFPQTRVRGCWYHFWNNMLCHSGLLNRVTEQTTKKSIINFLSVLPYLHHKELFLLSLIRRMEYKSELERHRDANYKLIMYVYATYVKRFQHLYHIDLRLSLERTNNSCEGSNSGLSKHSAQRLMLREFTEYAENQMKKQYLQKPSVLREPTNLDLVLITLQESSKKNVEDLVSALLAHMEAEDFRLKHLNANDFVFCSYGMANIDEDNVQAVEEMDNLLKKYKAIRAERKKTYRYLKQQLLNGMTNETVIENVEVKDNDCDQETDSLLSSDNLDNVEDLDGEEDSCSSKTFPNPFSLSIRADSDQTRCFSHLSSHTKGSIRKAVRIPLGYYDAQYII